MKIRKPKGAWHNLSHSVKYSDNLGYITPISCFDVVPGDRINHKVSALIRTQPLLAPVMHEVDIEVAAYFVPDRLVYEDAEEFQTGGQDGQSNLERPYMVAPEGGYGVGSLADYYGLPICDYNNDGDPIPVGGYEHDARPIRGYNLIYNTEFRDPVLENEIPISLAGGLDTTTPVNILRPAWKRDYFTKARPEPQLGVDVNIPLLGDAPIKFDSPNSGTSDLTGKYAQPNTGSQGAFAMRGSDASDEQGSDLLGNDYNSSLYADMAEVSGISIRELREAGAFQRYLETNNNWSGGRYMEQIMARFGIYPQDFRLQRPEFLGSGHTKVQFSEVLQTAEGVNPVGEMRGHGISVMSSNRYKYNVKEHGFIHIFLIIRPKTQYSQGLNRMWNRETRYDYLLPEFVHVGDQAVKNKELYVNSADPEGVFGYTPIYEEYRTIPSRVAGEFRTLLDFWHMARQFSSEPALNADFIKCNPTNRIFPSANDAQLYVNVKHDVKAYRPIPKMPSYRLM